MSDTAAHLADHVFAEVPVRQWVLSVPAPLRYLLAWDSALLSQVIGIFTGAVFSYLTMAAKQQGKVLQVSDGKPGSVCMVQR
jgi:hypothetical protein